MPRSFTRRLEPVLGWLKKCTRRGGVLLGEVALVMMGCVQRFVEVWMLKMVLLVLYRGWVDVRASCKIGNVRSEKGFSAGVLLEYKSDARYITVAPSLVPCFLVSQ